MFSIHLGISRLSALAAVGVVVVFAASAAYGSPTRTDYRSPDARDAAALAARPDSPPRTDLRSPDARDAADHVRFVTMPAVDVRPTTGEADFRWDDAGIGAGAAVLVLLAGTMVSIRRRHTSVTPVLPTT
jgi:hypothetical protein